jgi:hypothetical protein
LQTSERRLIVDYDDDDWDWFELGGGVPPILRQNELQLHKRDWFLLLNEVFGPWTVDDLFDGDVLDGEVARRLANRLLQSNIDADWTNVALWLRQGDCLFVAFPNQPMI